jgi:hypothetical protein
VYVLNCNVEHVLLLVRTLAAHRTEGVQQDFCSNRRQHYNICRSNISCLSVCGFVCAAGYTGVQ